VLLIQIDILLKVAIIIDINLFFKELYIMKNEALALMTMLGICTASHVFAYHFTDDSLDPKERAKKIHILRTDLGVLYQKWTTDPSSGDVHQMYRKEREFWKFTWLHEKEEKKK
jgi:hypothetical protein